MMAETRRIVLPPIARVRAVAMRWTDDAFPGWAEVHLSRHDGTTAVLIDKAPVFDIPYPDAAFPAELHLPCEVLEINGNGAVLVRLDFALEDTAGRNSFLVNRHDVAP
jgi:hypothetical protein